MSEPSEKPREPGGTSLSRQSHVALYQQIARHIEDEIASGGHAPFDRLETEHALMARFGVSRITVRLAVDDLVRKGLVLRKQGKGTFVTGPPVRHDLHELRGFVDVFLSQGRRPETRLLSFEAHEPPPDVERALNLRRGDRPMRLERLYISDGQPVGLAEAWLTPEAQRVTKAQAERHSTYDILQDLLGFAMTRADMAIRARIAGTAAGKLLAVPARTPLLLLVRTSYEAGGMPCEITKFLVNSEAYEFTLSTRGTLPAGTSLKAFHLQELPEAVPK